MLQFALSKWGLSQDGVPFIALEGFVTCVVSW